MIATPHFVFLHLHKSGGTFVNECLLRFVPGTRQIGYHLPRRLVPPELAHLPILGLVRNPWSYYVSWYAFQAARPEPNALFLLASDNRRLGFEGTIRNMLELGCDDALLGRAIAALPGRRMNRGLNLPGPALEELRGAGRGFYSFLYRYMYSGAHGEPTIVRMETLRDDLAGAIESVGQEVSAPMREFIARAEPRNASAHDDYVACYGPALRKLVAERDSEVIARHGYAFARRSP
jgi:hypothetical protein